MKKITLLKILIIIAYSIYTEWDYLYIFFKDVSKCSKYIYYNIRYNNNFLKVDFQRL